MNINWIFFLVSIIIAVYYSEGATSLISVPVAHLETVTYPIAHGSKLPSCKIFYHGLQFDPDTENGVPDYLKIDCGRYNRALACYRGVKNLPANAPPAEQDLSTNARTQIEALCQ